MRWWLVVLGGCGGPRLQGAWDVEGVLAGSGAVAQVTHDADGGCELGFQLARGSADLTWNRTCGRQDLPETAEQVGSWPGVGYAYQIGGGQGTNGIWLTRSGEHAGFDELWIGTEIDDPKTFDADQVLGLRRARGE